MIPGSFMPCHMRRPTAASHSITPTREDVGARDRRGSPRACSGAMYATLPLSTPVARLARRVGGLGDAEVDDLHLTRRR